MKHLLARWLWFKKELKKTEARTWIAATVGGGLLLIGGFWFLVFVGHYLSTNYYELPPLPDVSHKFLPYVPQLKLLDATGLFTSLIFFAIGISKEPHKIPLVFFISFLWFIVRTVSSLVTSLGVPMGPLPNPNLDIKSIWERIESGLWSKHILIFSGHTGLPILGLLLFQSRIKIKTLAWPLAFISAYYLVGTESHEWYWTSIFIALAMLILILRKNSLNIKYLFLIWSFIMGLMVLMTRGHYLVDVWIAIFITPGIYFIGRSSLSGLEKICEKIKSDWLSFLQGLQNKTP